MRLTEGWLWLIFMIGWLISSFADIVDFSFQVGEKNQITIEKVQKEEKKTDKEPTTEMPKSTW